MQSQTKLHETGNNTEKMKTFYYFIAYQAKKGIQSGPGNIGFSGNNEIDSMDALEAIQKQIREEKGFDALVISNFQLLRVENSD